MSQVATAVAFDPVVVMRSCVAAWAVKPADEQKETLFSWLQSYGLPPVGHEEEPVVWILRGLPLGADRLLVREALALHVATLLDKEPDVAIEVRHPERYLDNLLNLAAGLRRPNVLTEPLWRMFERDKLTGSSLGLDLRQTLAVALAANQVDDRLRDEWMAAIRQDGTQRLPGSPIYGWQAIERMPDADGNRPNFDAVGEALTALAHAFETDAGRHSRLAELCMRFVERHRNLPGNDSNKVSAQLIDAADKWNFPCWAAGCLPRLRVPSARRHQKADPHSSLGPLSKST